MSGNEQRLPRLLALVPYLQAHQGIAAATAAADFGITEEQLRRDLELLWMCGLPGHGPGDLIDLSFEGDTVSVIFDAGMSRPLRLTAEEALALVVALRTLAETPGLADGDAVQRALAKVEAAAGGEVDDTTVAVELDAAARLLPALHRALNEGRALKLRYYTATRDETTERVVDPLRVFEMDGRSYLEAWCRRAEGCGCSGSTGSSTSSSSRSRRDRRPMCSCAIWPKASTSRLRAPARRASAGAAVLLGGRLLPDRRGARVRRAAAGQLAGGRSGLGARARARLLRPGRGALARLAGRVDPLRRRHGPQRVCGEVEFAPVSWMPLFAWLGAVVIAAVVLGFCALRDHLEGPAAAGRPAAVAG